MTFPEFLHAYRTGALELDAAWRAYDIPGSALTGSTRRGKRARFVEFALKRLGLAYAGELAIPQFMAMYQVPTPEEARAILGAWWLWSGIDAGRAMGVPLRGRHPTAGAEKGA